MVKEQGTAQGVHVHLLDVRHAGLEYFHSDKFAEVSKYVPLGVAMGGVFDDDILMENVNSVVTQVEMQHKEQHEPLTIPDVEKIYEELVVFGDLVKATTPMLSIQKQYGAHEAVVLGLSTRCEIVVAVVPDSKRKPEEINWDGNIPF